jgi:hypothetical protein
MATIIFTHMRSRGTLLMNHFHQAQGEIFNLHGMTAWKKANELYDLNVESLVTTSFAKEQLQYIKNLPRLKTSTFKVCWCDLVHWPEARGFIINELKPKIITMERFDKLSTIKSLLIGERKGYFKDTELQTVDQFIVDRSTFDKRFYSIVHEYHFGKLFFEKYFNIEYAFAYETFFNENKIELLEKNVIERIPESSIIDQDSKQYFHLIKNEKEINIWFNEEMTRFKKLVLTNQWYQKN